MYCLYGAFRYHTRHRLAKKYPMKKKKISILYLGPTTIVQLLKFRFKYKALQRIEVWKSNSFQHFLKERKKAEQLLWWWPVRALSRILLGIQWWTHSNREGCFYYMLTLLTYIYLYMLTSIYSMLTHFKCLLYMAKAKGWLYDYILTLLTYILYFVNSESIATAKTTSTCWHSWPLTMFTLYFIQSKQLWRLSLQSRFFPFDIVDLHLLTSCTL